MMTRRAVVIAILLSSACQSVDYYSDPGRGEDFATIGQCFSEGGGFKTKARIKTIDRKEVKWKCEEDNSLTPGSHRIHIHACESALMAGFCSETVLMLHAIAGERYKIGASVSKDKKEANFWISNAETDEVVSGPVTREAGADVVILPVPL